MTDKPLAPPYSVQTNVDASGKLTFQVMVPDGGSPPIIPPEPTPAPVMIDFNQAFGTFGGYPNVSPDGLWEIASWPGTGGNSFSPSRALIDTAAGTLTLVVEPGPSKLGGEIASVSGKTGRPASMGSGYGYGYYETEMKVTPVAGVCASFFWIGAPDYSGGEWDVEFLTNESPRTKVHYTMHPSGKSVVYDLGFDWSADFHRYGFLWTPGKIDYTVDGHIVFSWQSGELSTTKKGFIMANCWTGNANWGGTPPSVKASTVYKYMKHWPGVTTIPTEARGTLTARRAGEILEARAPRHDRRPQ